MASSEPRFINVYAERWNVLGLTFSSAAILAACGVWMVDATTGGYLSDKFKEFSQSGHESTPALSEPKSAPDSNDHPECSF